MPGKLFKSLIGLWSISLFLFACANKEVELAMESITAEDLSEDIAILASDDFEGRAPSSRGEIKTINFLKTEFQKLGLQPGGENESFFQEVPLVAITASTDMELKIKGENWHKSLSFSQDFMAWTKRVVGNVSINNSEMLFVGYGIVAPEYDWNDYAGLDVKGKTVVMLVNDPGFAMQDDALFNGNAMTFYGRWTYKYEEAARQGAEAALIIHETKAAGYPWDVVSGSWTGAQFDLLSADNNMSRCAVEGWLSNESARELFEQAGLDFDQLTSTAAKRDFQATAMNLSASLTIQNDIEHSRSNNVLALLPGSRRPNEYVIYMAHWDHLGLDPAREGDKIFNGALDNATGTAALIELAEAFTQLSTPPERSLVFLALTAEEQGLLGSQYYATHPIYPITKTAAAINMDGMNIYGKMNDITIIGFGNSDLDDYVQKVAAEQKRTVRPDPEPEKGYFYRSDHFSFAKQGIPALYTDMGIDHVKFGEKWTREQLDKYTAENYHKPSDEFDPDWDLTGMVDDVRLLFKVGYLISSESAFPNWKEGTEFKAKRDEDMKMRLSESSN
ncbi:MAG: M28 family metallopeptidase [bacterium]